MEMTVDVGTVEAGGLAVVEGPSPRFPLHHPGTQGWQPLPSICSLAEAR